MHENMKELKEKTSWVLYQEIKSCFYHCGKKSAKKSKSRNVWDQWRNLLLPHCIGRKCKLFVMIVESEAGKSQLLLWKWNYLFWKMQHCRPPDPELTEEWTVKGVSVITGALAFRSCRMEIEPWFCKPELKCVSVCLLGAHCGISKAGMVAVPGAGVGPAKSWGWTHGFVICSLFLFYVLPYMNGHSYTAD